MTDTEYWVKVANYDALYSAFEDRIENLEVDNENNKTSISNIENSLSNFTSKIKFLSDYDVVGDGVADDTDAIQTAIDDLNDGECLISDENMIYKITSQLVVNKNNVCIDFSNSKINYIGNENSAIKISTDEKYYTTLSQAYIFQEDGVKIHVADISNISVGDIIKIKSDNDVWDTQRAYYRNGGVALVEKITGNILHLNGGFDTQNMQTLADVTVIKPCKNVHIKNLRMTCMHGYGVILHGILVDGCVDTTLTNINIDIFERCITINNCVNTEISKYKTGSVRPDTSYLYDGYGIALQESRNTHIHDGYGKSGQHAIAIGGEIPVYNTIIERCTIFSEFSTRGLDNHINNYDISIRDCVINGAFCHGVVSMENVLVTQLNGTSEPCVIQFSATSGDLFRCKYIFNNIHGENVRFQAYAENGTCNMDGIEINNSKFEYLEFYSLYVNNAFNVTIKNSTLKGITTINRSTIRNMLLENVYCLAGAKMTLGANDKRIFNLTIKNLIIPKIANMLSIFALNLYIEGLQVLDSTETGTYTAYTATNATFINLASSGLDAETFICTNASFISSTIGTNSLTNVTNKSAMSSHYKNGTLIS